METQIEMPTFDEVKQLYNSMKKEHAREKWRIYDKEYKKKKYENNTEFREKKKMQSKAQRDKQKAEKSNQRLAKS